MAGRSWKGAVNGEKAVVGRPAFRRSPEPLAQARRASPTVERRGSGDQARIGTVVVDHAPLFRAGAKAVLAGGGFPVLGEAAGVAEGVELARHRRAQVLVLGDASVTEAVEAASSLPGCAVVVLVAGARRPGLVAMLNAGVAGLALRSLPPEDLVSTVETVAHGGRSVEPVLVPLLAGFEDQVSDGNGSVGDAAREEGPTDPLLTPRECSVLAQLARGASNSQIAKALYVTPATVKTHLAHIYVKLGVAGRHEALTRALELGLLS